MKDITVYQELVTPEKAREWLKLNLDHNRPVKDRYVSQLSMDISAGRWKLTGDTIKFDVKGHLIDGQHRLNAVIESDKPVPMFIARGVATGIEKIIDQGNKRTISDILHISGEANTLGLGACLSMLCHYDGVTFRNESKRYAPSNGMRLEKLKEYPDVVGISGRIRKHKEYRRLGFPAQLAAVWVLAELKAPGMGEQFFEMLGDPALRPGNQAFVLRERLINARLMKASRLNRWEALAVIVKAWNAFRSGKTVSQLKYNRLGPKSEPFPTMV